MAPRQRLPNRRSCETHEVVITDKVYVITLGFYDDGRLGEIFASGAKVGSEVNAILADGAILASRCLQLGDTIEAMAPAMSRLPSFMLADATDAATVFGAALDMALERVSSPQEAIGGPPPPSLPLQAHEQAKQRQGVNTGAQGTENGMSK